MSFIAAVVFDLDDTLYPEREYAFSGFAAVARAFADKLGDPARAEADMRRLFETEHRPRVFNAIVAERGRCDAAALVPRMVEVYRSHRPAIHLHSDADGLLFRLRANYKLGLITDGGAITQWAKIGALNLRCRLDEIIVTSELVSVGRGQVDMVPSASVLSTAFAKPHPRAFELIAERLGVAAGECCYVADNPTKDFVAPNVLGWLSVRVCRRDGIYNEAVVAPGGQPQHRIDSLDALDMLLG